MGPKSHTPTRQYSAPFSRALAKTHRSAKPLDQWCRHECCCQSLHPCKICLALLLALATFKANKVSTAAVAEGVAGK